MLFTSSRKPSSATWLSVNKNITFSFLTPTRVYSVLRSSRNICSSYPRVSVISKTPHPAVYAASFERLCFPDPPTPTSNALPWSRRMMRCMRVRCSSASSKNTRFIGFCSSLYSSSTRSKRGLTSS